MNRGQILETVINCVGGLEIAVEPQVPLRTASVLTVVMRTWGD